MMNKKIGVLLLFALLVSFGAKAQLATSMRINEVLVINEDNFVDDYGKRHGWIELYNSSAGTVNIAGCFLTDDKNNPKKYPIPKGDVLTQIPPGQHVLFWADNEPDRGTFHVSFSLDPTKENYVALYNADGKTLIDEVTIPAGQVADVSFGRIIDGKEEWAQLTKVTPSTNNLTLDSNDRYDHYCYGSGIPWIIPVVCYLQTDWKNFHRRQQTKCQESSWNHTYCRQCRTGIRRNIRGHRCCPL